MQFRTCIDGLHSRDYEFRLVIPLLILRQILQSGETASRRTHYPEIGRAARPSAPKCVVKHKYKQKGMKDLTEISKEDIQKLLARGIIKNTDRGYVDITRKDETGKPARVGYYRTVNGRHRYIEDGYARMLKNKKGTKGRFHNESHRHA